MKNVQLLTENLRALGHDVFPLVRDERNFVPGAELEQAHQFEVTEWQKNSELRAIYEHNLKGLEESDAVILLLPAGKSSHIQAGIAFGLGKKTILIGTPEAAESHYFIFNEIYDSIEAYLAIMRP